MRHGLSNKIKVMVAAVGVVAVTACTTAETKPPVTASTTSSTTQTASAPAPIAAKPAQATGIREPNWQFSAGSTDKSVSSYVDVNNIAQRNGYLYAYDKIIYSTIQVEDGQAYTSTVRLFAYDCRNSRQALTQFVDHATNGSSVYLSPVKAHLDWRYVIPGTIGAANLEFVCNVSAGYTQVATSAAPPAQAAVSSRVSPAEVFKRVKDSVWVLVSFDLKNGKPDLDNAALGSAVAVGPSSLLTNCHTLKGHAYHLITRTDAEEPNWVTILKADYAGDRCIVQTQERLPGHVEIKPYSVIDIGEEAYSVGAPRGLELTMADGIVSGKRTLDGVRYLQTTAPISPGSSGGGLFDGSGRLIGITTMYRKDGQNLNFAIAADAF